MNTSIYADIARRTGGNIYLGIVGPVRSGKSTFISRFMNKLVIPNISDEYAAKRAADELPQSSAGKTIMTTEPKFVPEEAAAVSIGDVKMNVRLIDCVGYIVPSAVGYIENNAPRMVMTSWFDEEIPFNMAAEIGTRKVINDHSTIGVVVTTDGTIADIPRKEYEEAEEKIIAELNEINKPFVILLNSREPNSSETKKLAEEMSEKYGERVIAVSCSEMDEEDIAEILGEVLLKFPVKEVKIKLPWWVMSLKKDHKLKKDVIEAIKTACAEITDVSKIKNAGEKISECEYIKRAEASSPDLGTGTGIIDISLNDELFYQILGEETGLDIHCESDLMPCMLMLAEIKKKYERVKNAIDEVEATGYGIVLPQMEEMKLEEPEIIKQGGKYGVRLKASAPSIYDERGHYYGDKSHCRKRKTIRRTYKLPA